MKIPSLLILILFLSSFSPSKSKKVNIVFIGDSITEGGALPNPGIEATPLLAAQILKTKKNILDVQHANAGYSGHTTVDFLPATHTDFPKVLAAARSFASDKDATLVFSILLGTNDSAIFGPNGAPVSAPDYEKNITTIIDALLEQFPNARFVLQYPIWYSPNTHNNAGYMQEGLDRLESYLSRLENVVEAYKKTHPKQVFAGDKHGFAIFKKKHQALMRAESGKKGTFYLHPNAAGSKVLAKVWVKGILRALKGVGDK